MCNSLVFKDRFWNINLNVTVNYWMRHISMCSKMQLSSSFTDQMEAQKTKNSTHISENEKVNLHKNYILTFVFKLQVY